MRSRRAGAAAIGVGLAGVTVAGIMAFGTEAVPERVDPVIVGSASGPALPALSGRTGPGGVQVPALDRVEGTLARVGNDADDLSIRTVELDLGPEEWVVTAGPVGDFDGDGNTGDLLTDLEGLLGRPVTVLGLLDGDGDEIAVYEINGVAYRDSTGGPAPWQQPTAPSGAVSSQADIAAAAVAAVGAGARIDEMDRLDAGAVAWEIEVIDAMGREQRVLLDASAAVLDVRPED